MQTILEGSSYENGLNWPSRPFPSSCLPPLQSESKCEIFVVVISPTLHMNETNFHKKNFALRGCLHVKSHTGTSFILVRVVNFIPRLHGRHKY